MQNNASFEGMIKRMVIAPAARKAAAIESVMALLDGKPPDRLLYSGADACRLLSISQTSLWRLRQARKIIPVCVLNRPKYRHEDLMRLAQGTVTP
ncbi:MAG: helix-turn-helix domain-containing protein [Patescibacteria group bacterium]